MDLITTHKNADFDALSSLVAVSKLYPKARLLLPGSQERSVRKFLSLIKDKIKIESDKTCDLSDVTRLIIVDNRHKSRIGMASDLVGKKGVEVHVYDHHPRTRSDIKADKDVFKEVGATVTMLLEILVKEKRFSFTPLEATLMLIGIYEETGSLSHLSTTKLDVDMVSRLLTQGANLNTVSSYLNRELSGDELTALIELLESTEIIDVKGIGIAFAEVHETKFDGERSAVVHKLQDVENYPVLFAMFTSGDKLKIFARSRLELIDVNKLLNHLGGAGHSSAASVRLEGRSPAAVKNEIVRLLREVIHPEVYAKDIMSLPAKTVSEEDKVFDILEWLTGLGYNGAPVLNEDGELVGMITLSDLKKAIKRKMGHSRVKGYMATRLVTAHPDTPLHMLRRIVIEKGKGRIPVIENNKLIGIVTRTDVLKKIHSSLFSISDKKHITTSDLFPRMRKLLPKKLMEFIRAISSEADDRGIGAFLVGGFVRDVIMGKKNYDLDVVVEGDAIEFGRVLGDRKGGSLVAHKKFGTATLVREWPKWLGPSLHPDNKFKIDIAAARKETYAKPAALPTVKFSSLKEDLYRRDFTINAMAVCINKNNFGQFVDFFGGIKDLENKIIRVLHDKSFIDDPTRIFRAVRFEQRLGFKIEKHTEYLITHAVKKEMFKRTENQRIRDELILMLKEKHPEKAVFRMKELHELRFIHENLILKKNIKKTFVQIKKCVKWYSSADVKRRELNGWLMNLMVMLDKLTSEEVDEVAKKFVFTRDASIKLRGYKKDADSVMRKLASAKRTRPSEIYDLLEPLSHEIILCVMARTNSRVAQNRIRKFFVEYDGVKVHINGSDIKKEGIKPGPRYKRLLREILHKKIDGKFTTKRQEVQYMRELIGKKERKQC